MLGIRTRTELEGHPKVGASWEGFAFEEILRLAEPDRHYFWRTHNGAELDMLLMKGTRKAGVELKRTDAPSMTPSMHHALKDLNLGKIWVVHAGTRRYPLHEAVEAIPLADVAKGRKLL